MSTERIARLIGHGLVDATTGAAVSLRAGRGPRIVFVPHPAGCPDCGAYIERLAALVPALAGWDGRVTVITHGAPHAEALLERGAGRVQLLADPDGMIDATPPAIVTADEWGEVHFQLDGGADHALPDERELLAWMRFIGIQCPECEQPEGEWRNIG